MPISVVIGCWRCDAAHQALILPAVRCTDHEIVELPAYIRLSGRRCDVAVLESHGEAEAQTVRDARLLWPSAQIVCLEAASEHAVVRLMEAGADIATPRGASPSVTTAAIAACVRRVVDLHAQSRIVLGDLVYDRESRRLWCAGQEIFFTPKEERLFDFLFVRVNRSIDAGTLRRHVWRDESDRPSNTLPVHIGYLRRKLATSRQVRIVAERGVGYRLVCAHDAPSQAPAVDALSHHV